MKIVLIILGILLCASVIMLGSADRNVRRIKTTEKIIALTFDDGPHSPYTELLLEILREKEVQATFFLVGQRVEQNPKTTALILNDGHDIGGHSYGWDSYLFKNDRFVHEQLNLMEKTFADAGITQLVYFRPPGGLLRPGQGKLLEGCGYTLVSADVVVGDWKKVDAETIRKRVVKKVKPGSIIVLHDGGGDRTETVKAVPGIIDELEAQGYEFLTVSELLKVQK